MKGLRITGGIWRGRIIHLPKNCPLRPSSERIREVLFNVLGEKVKGSDLLDLFSGSGALGIEALSRGAKKVVFVEKRREYIEMIKRSLSLLGGLAEGRTCVLRMDVFKAIEMLDKKKEPFDLILLDPPYLSGLAYRVLLKIAHSALLSPEGIIFVEHHKRGILPDRGENLKISLIDQHKSGDTVLSLFKNTC